MPNDPNIVNYVDNNIQLFRETLLMMRIKLKSDERMYAVIKTLYTILQNILINPLEIKY